MHPSLATLLAYLDNELSRECRRNTERHLGNCARCRSELRLTGMELRQVTDLEVGRIPEQAFEPNLEAIRASLRSRQEVRPAATASGSALDRRIAEQLAIYLGRHAAALALDPAAACSKEPGLLHTAEQLCATFLGRKAAAALVGQVLDGLALERNLAAKQLGC